MLRFQALRSIVFRYKYRLVLTYALFGLEMFGSLLRPFFVGEAVNDLITGSYKGLAYLAAVHLVYLTAGTVRHMLDTRTYTDIYTSFVTQMLSRKINDADISKLSAHSTLAREFIDFLEFDLNFMVEALYNILGSLIMMSFYDHSVVLTCMAFLIPVMRISYLYGKKMERLTKNKNDELERQVDIIKTKNHESISRHYNSLRKWQIKISDREAWNFGIMELIALPIIIISLLFTSAHAGSSVKAGDIIGIYNYLLKFIAGLETIPYTLQRLTTLKDITRRIEHEDGDL